MAADLQARESSSKLPQEQHRRAAVAGGADGGSSSAVPRHCRAAGPEFSIVQEEVVHARYLTLYNQAVQFPPLEGQAEVGRCLAGGAAAFLAAPA
jgi:hypothetical protein